MPFSLADRLDQTTTFKKSFIQRHPVISPIFILIVLVASIYFISAEKAAPLIGVIPVDGVIFESETVIQKLRTLEENPAVRGIIVHVNSPGGAVAPSQEIFSELLRVGKKLPIYTSMSSIAASGGYYIAVGTQKIFANPGTLTGSIGVIMQTYNLEALMDKIGVYSEVIKSGKNKDIGSSFRKMTDSDRQLLTDVIKDTHSQFVQAVSDNRPLDKEQVERLADGRIFTGQQAYAEKLVDGLLGFRETVARIKQDIGITEPVELYYVPDKKDSIFSIVDLLGSISNIKQQISLNGLLYLNPSLINY